MLSYVRETSELLDWIHDLTERGKDIEEAINNVLLDCI